MTSTLSPCRCLLATNTINISNSELSENLPRIFMSSQEFKSDPVAQCSFISNILLISGFGWGGNKEEEDDADAVLPLVHTPCPPLTFSVLMSRVYAKMCAQFGGH